MDDLPTSNTLPNEFTLPAAFPPPGVESNFLNPLSSGKSLVVTSALCITFMAICVAIRFYTKLHIKKVWGWDDWLCIPATIGTVGFTATALSVLGEGVGPHQWNVPITAFTPDLLRKFVVLDMLYSPTILMAKLSLLALYLRIFEPNQRMKYCIYFSIWFLCLFYTAAFTAFAILSIPKPGQTQLESILSVNTAKDIPLSITQGAINVASDFFIFCLPMPVVWNLHLPLKKKIGVLAIFATGLLACVASAIGLYYRVKLGRNSDVTWKLVFVLLWVIVELTVGVTCSCLASFPGFFRYHTPQLRSLLSIFSSSLKRLNYANQQTGSSDHRSEKKLATKDIKVTLGSRIDGEGRFLDPESVVAPGRSLSSPSELICSPTRREAFEGLTETPMPVMQDIRSFHNDTLHESSWETAASNANLGLSSREPFDYQNPIVEAGQRQPKTWKWWRRSDEAQNGYWDIMSIFRTKDRSLPVHSKNSSGSEESRF